MNTRRVWVVTFGLIFAVVLFTIIGTIALDLEYAEMVATAALGFTILGFMAVYYALNATIAQFKKSMAKPHIKVAFNEKGDQSFTLTYKDNGVTNSLPPLWLRNEGNAISQHFQIDIIIPESIINPEIIGKSLTYVTITRDNGNCIFSYTNDEDYTLFVHKPKQPQNMNLSIAIDNHKCMKLPKNNFKLKYYIYGDWAETQEGELKIQVKKQ